MVAITIPMASNENPDGYIEAEKVKDAVLNAFDWDSKEFSWMNAEAICEAAKLPKNQSVFTMIGRVATKLRLKRKRSATTRFILLPKAKI